MAQATTLVSGDFNETCALPGGSECSLQLIDPASTYQLSDPTGQGAEWISYADTGRPGTVTVAPGYAVSVYESFDVDAGDSLKLYAWADNWIEVFLDGSSVFSTDATEMFQPGAEAFIEYLFLTSGEHTLRFDLYQGGELEPAPGNPLGLMYSGTVAPVSEVPLPPSFLLFFTGLLALAASRRVRT